MESWTALLVLHATAATLAVVLGAVQVVRPRKGDRVHRRLGRVWMALMYWVAISSFGIRQLDPGHFSWIHAVSVWTILSLSLAIRAARHRNVASHRRWATGSYLGLLGAGVGAVAVPDRLVRQTAAHDPLTLLLTLVGVTITAVAVTVLAVRLPPRAGSPSPTGAAGAGTDAGSRASVALSASRAPARRSGAGSRADGRCSRHPAGWGR